MVRWLSLRCSASQRWGFRPLGSSAWGKSLPTSSTEVSGGTQLPGMAFPTGSQVRGTERKDEGRRAETVSQFVIAPTAAHRPGSPRGGPGGAWCAKRSSHRLPAAPAARVQTRHPVVSGSNFR